MSEWIVAALHAPRKYRLIGSGLIDIIGSGLIDIVVTGQTAKCLRCEVSLRLVGVS
jgi:hypothetical protein